MPDVFDKRTRSEIMSKIRSKDTKPEMLVRRFLHRNGFRYRLHAKDLPGKPDIVLPKYKSIVFVHGCFWHSHAGCRRANTPSSNKDYWVAKLKKNKDKDIRDQEKLSSSGWRVVVVWECSLSTIDKRRAGLERLVEILQSDAAWTGVVEIQ